MRCRGVDAAGGRSCARVEWGDVERLAARSAPPGAGDRFVGAVRLLRRVVAELRGRGVRVAGLVFFGSLVKGGMRLDSDVDVLLVYEGGVDVEGLLGGLLPRVVRLKRIPGGVDAHTQYLDVEDGVLLHIIPVEAGRLGERLEYVDGPCVAVGLDSSG